MTPEQLTQRMQGCIAKRGEVTPHRRVAYWLELDNNIRQATALMCEFLRDAGCGEAVDIYETLCSWREKP